MCTLTWWREGVGSFEVFFNRDERKTRSRAEPPRVHKAEGVSFLAPTDPDGGGTWMLVNERRLLVCLLNRWHEDSEDFEPMRSRGQLVLDMAGLENVPAVEERLRMEDLAGIRPFTMVGFDPVGERAWSWNGNTLSVIRNPEMPLCSSSFHYAEVAAARRSLFQEMRYSSRQGSKLLESFHGATDDGHASAFTPRMLRTNAQTMSRSHVSVTGTEISWVYLEEQPELAAEPKSFQAQL